MANKSFFCELAQLPGKMQKFPYPGKPIVWNLDHFSGTQGSMGFEITSG